MNNIILNIGNTLLLSGQGIIFFTSFMDLGVILRLIGLTLVIHQMAEKKLYNTVFTLSVFWILDFTKLMVEIWT